MSSSQSQGKLLSDQPALKHLPVKATIGQDKLVPYEKEYTYRSSAPLSIASPLGQRESFSVKLHLKRKQG